jgi:hypothetical protein
MTDQTLDLLDWVESGTIARREVIIYNDLALVAEADAAEEALRVALSAASEDAERSMGEPDDVAAARERLDDIYARWEASKAVWTVRALDDDEIRVICEELPAPERPASPAPDASPEWHHAHQDALRMWVKESQDVTDERNLRYVSKAVVSVVTAKGTATEASVGVLRTMRARAHGKMRLALLIKATEEATTGDVSVSPGESRASSTSSQS